MSKEQSTLDIKDLIRSLSLYNTFYQRGVLIDDENDRNIISNITEFSAKIINNFPYMTPQQFDELMALYVELESLNEALLKNFFKSNIYQTKVIAYQLSIILEKNINANFQSGNNKIILGNLQRQIIEATSVKAISDIINGRLSRVESLSNSQLKTIIEKLRNFFLKLTYSTVDQVREDLNKSLTPSSR